MAKISKEKIGKLAQWLDDIIELKGIVEHFDGFAFKTGLNFINDKFGDNIPDNISPILEGIIDDVVSENYEGAEQKAAQLFAELINTPLIDGTDDEIEAYQTIISGLDNLVRSLLKPKNA